MLVLLIPAGLLLAIDVYFFQIVKTSLLESSDRVRLAVYSVYWLLTVLTIASIFVGANRGWLPAHIRYYMFSISLLIVIPKIVGCFFLLTEDVFRIGSGLIGLLDNDQAAFLPSRRKFVSTAALVTASVPFASMIYGMVRTGFNIRLRKETISFNDLPDSFDGLKIVQISDLHSGSFVDESFFEEAVSRINDLKPDLVFFTGDLVNNEAVEAERFVPTFKKIQSKYGVYSILGNHDYGAYGPWSSDEDKRNNFQRLVQIHADSGWKLLANQNDVISSGSDQIAIVGVENWGAARHFPKRGDLNHAVKNVENVDFKILLSHDPSHWDAHVQKHEQKFQLTLSGHTHGAQIGIEIPGFKWSPAKYAYKQWAGLYEGKDGQNLYVNRGLGFIGYMGRIGIPPEITLLELKSSENSLA